MKALQQNILRPALGILCLAMTTWSSAWAGELTPQQQTQILHEANEQYHQGQRKAGTDPAEAKQAFSVAAQKYQTLVDSGVTNGRLYFNLANAQIHTGDLGRAIANYQRAATLLPGNRSVRANLRYARSRLPHAQETELQSPSLGQILSKWNDAISWNVRLAVAAVAWILVWLAAMVRFRFRRFPLRYVAVPALVLFSLSTVSLCFTWYPIPANERGIVVAQTVIRTGNGEAFAPKYQQPLHTGDPFDLVQRRGDWLKIRTPAGQTGWVWAHDVEQIRPRPSWLPRLGST